MQTVKLKWTGIRPIIMHNGLLADKLNPYSRRIREITDKGSRKISEADLEELARLEWEGGLNWSNKEGPVILSDAIERCIQQGAQKSRKGKDVLAVVFCTEPEIRLGYDGPRTKDKLLSQMDTFSIRKGVSVNQSRVIRVRPMFPTGWTLEFELEFDETILNMSDLLKACVNAGALIGLGDWRPKFGRFTVEVIEP